MAARAVSASVFLLSLLVLSAISNVYATTCTPPAAPKSKPPAVPKSKPPAIPKSKPHPTPTAPAKCPIDTLKLGTCTDLLGLFKVVIGTPHTSPCCTALQGLADLESALCLCTAIKENILGIQVNVPVAVSTIISACQKTVPPGFQCP